MIDRQVVFVGDTNNDIFPWPGESHEPCVKVIFLVVYTAPVIKITCGLTHIPVLVKYK